MYFSVGGLCVCSSCGLFVDCVYVYQLWSLCSCSLGGLCVCNICVVCVFFSADALCVYHLSSVCTCIGDYTSLSFMYRLCVLAGFVLLNVMFMCLL